MPDLLLLFFFFFFNDTATTEIYTLSLHDALPISTRPAGRAAGRSDVRHRRQRHPARVRQGQGDGQGAEDPHRGLVGRSEEHTSELQSRPHLVCRLLLEKKNTTTPPQC